MTDTQTIVRGYFHKLGLDTEIADIYLSLYAYGPQSMSGLSRSSRIERTRIYRLIDTLLASNLIEVETLNKRAIIKAAPIANLHILLAQKEQDIASLRDELGMIEQIMARNSLSNPAVRIESHRGREAVRNMLSHELTSKTQICGFEPFHMEQVVGTTYYKRFAADMKRTLIKQNFLTNDISMFIESVDQGQVEYKIIDATTLQSDSICHVYDDRIHHYMVQDDDSYGVALISKELAQTQRQLYELALQHAS